MVPGNEERGQGFPRQRDLEPSETTHRQGRHTGHLGLQIEIGTQWSRRQIQSAQCSERLQTSGRTGLFDTFGPTCKPQTFRILLQLSKTQGHVMHQFDIKTAFMRKTCFLEQPQVFEKRRSDKRKLYLIKHFLF